MNILSSFLYPQNTAYTDSDSLHSWKVKGQGYDINISYTCQVQY